MKKLLEKRSIADFWKQDGNTWGLCPPAGSIYHYTHSIKTVENILTTGELWLSKSTVMNDFSEIRYGCDLFIKVAKEELKGDLMNLIVGKFREIIDEKFFGDLFILCFSENGNSRLLWDSYSRKNGYNIELSSAFIKEFLSNVPLEIMTLNSENKEFVKENFGNNIEIVKTKGESSTSSFSYSLLANKVLYDRKQQTLILKEALEIIKEAYDNDNFLDISLCMSCVLDFIPFFKDPTLKEEEEYRLVVKFHNETRKQGKKGYLRPVQHYREVDNMLFPYIVIMMNFPLKRYKISFLHFRRILK